MFEITRQYMDYVELMKAVNLELAAEYLVMAAVLAEIKSRMLLPRPPSDDGEEEDPRAELVRRLQEYERFKKAAEDLDGLPRTGRDVYLAAAETPNLELVKPLPEVDLREILLAMREVMQRAQMFSAHHVQKEVLSVRERMSRVLEHLSQVHFTDFQSLFDPEEGRMGVVVSFLAIMELSKESLIEIIQSEVFGPIHVRAKVQ
jgi:segregation and condensation protein A